MKDLMKYIQAAVEPLTRTPEQQQKIEAEHLELMLIKKQQESLQAEIDKMEGKPDVEAS